MENGVAGYALGGSNIERGGGGKGDEGGCDHVSQREKCRFTIHFFYKSSFTCLKRTVC